MKKLQKEFIEFNKSIKCSETDALIDKRDMLKKDIEDKFPDNCKKYGIEINKSDLEFINQGSYKIGTAIDSDNVDIDYAVIFPLDINEFNDPRNVKKAVRDSLFIENKRIPKIKEPCVTVAYHENDKEYMHIDFPVYASNNGLLYLGRGKEHSESYEWENADPKGLSEYFLNEFKDREQLKRIVRYIKKWKQIKYQNSNNSHEVPPSVGLTILACNYYFEYTYEGDDDLSSFYYNISKSKAVAFSLNLIHPEIKAKPIDEYLTEENYDKIIKRNQVDLIIFTVGSSDVQLRMNKKFIEENISIPIYYAWLEHDGETSHLAIINNYYEGCFECLYTNGSSELCENTVNKADKSTIRYIKNGCNGTRVPYGNKTLLTASAMILKAINDNKQGNWLYSYHNDQIIIEKFPKNSECKCCGVHL